MPKTVRSLLDELITEVLDQLGPARDRVVTLERELADARRALAALDGVPASDPMSANINRLIHATREARAAHYGGGQGRDIKPPSSPYGRLTMKQLVRKALDEQFHNGATANELLAHFRDVYGRSDIVRTSLSPQLSRLKGAGDIILRGKKWLLAGRNETLALRAPEKIEPSNAGAEDGS